MMSAINAREGPYGCMGISSWDKGRGYGYQIYREEFLEELASEPILKLARQRRTKWGGEILPRKKKRWCTCVQSKKTLGKFKDFQLL